MNQWEVRSKALSACAKRGAIASGSCCSDPLELLPDSSGAGGRFSTRRRVQALTKGQSPGCPSLRSRGVAHDRQRRAEAVRDGAPQTMRMKLHQVGEYRAAQMGSVS